MSTSSAAAEHKAPAMLGVDLLRHLFVLAVIFQHMLSHARYDDAVNAQIEYWSMLVDGAVAGFFLLSGYFSRTGLTGRGVATRARRILLPYLVFSLGYAVSLAALGKLNLVQGLFQTAVGAGVGPQLYFLPYLFLISVTWLLAICQVPERRQHLTTVVTIVVLFLIYLALPTASSTGPDPRLLTLYSIAFIWGFYRRNYAGNATAILIAVLAMLTLVLCPWQSRLWDLPLVVLLVEIALRSSALLGRGVRLPGSGGVYLLHTPILNFALASLLLVFGISGMANVLVTVGLTYIVALAMTLCMIRAVPFVRPYLLE